MKRLLHFFKKETVLCSAALLALISMFFVPPTAAYIEYMDLRVLCLLFCLMLVVEGMQTIGVFSFLGQKLLCRAHNTRFIAFVLTGLCFLTSMLITNDVALITFVPFAVMILTMTGQNKLLIPVIVLQTIAANLGSMLTPIGNPQNLYLYSFFNISFWKFILHMLPLTLASALMLALTVLLIKKEPLAFPESTNKARITSKPRLIVYSLLFMLCLLCVLRILPYPLMLAVVFAAVLATDKKLLKKADYFLLLTFICFFIFIGNMQHIPAVCNLLSRLISGRELLLGILLSQFISNVPSAILLSGFTSNCAALLYGVNIGGLGTLIASLASVISYRCYVSANHAKTGKYILTFTIYNVVFLVVLSSLAVLIV